MKRTPLAIMYSVFRAPNPERVFSCNRSEVKSDLFNGGNDVCGSSLPLRIQSLVDCNSTPQRRGQKIRAQTSKYHITVLECLEICSFCSHRALGAVPLALPKFWLWTITGTPWFPAAEPAQCLQTITVRTQIF